MKLIYFEISNDCYLKNSKLTQLIIVLTNLVYYCIILKFFLRIYEFYLNLKRFSYLFNVLFIIWFLIINFNHKINYYDVFIFNQFYSDLKIYYIIDLKIYLD